MKKLKQTSVIIILLINVSGYSQRGIGTNNPNRAAILELKSTKKGFLMPRLTSDEMKAILNPPEGLMVYCTNCSIKSPFFYNGTNWLSLIDNATPPIGKVIHKGLTYLEVTSNTGAVWLDRNLGATRVAVRPADLSANGNYYQWGRKGSGWIKDDGYDLSKTWNAGDKNNPIKLIATDPCPQGYRIPTVVELNKEILMFSTNDRDGAFASPLKLPVNGYHYESTGTKYNVGVRGYYWSSTLSTINPNHRAQLLYINVSTTGIRNYYRGSGVAVRCIKE